MRARLVIGLVATSLLAAASPAHAADPILAHDTKISSISPLGGDLVYRRDVRPVPKRVWMALFHGRLRHARGIPDKRTIFSGDIGLDAKGRKVFTFGSWHQKNGVILSTKWFAYDLASNRTRPLGGLPAKCVVGWAAVWRGSMAYTAGCKSDSKSGLFVKQGKSTRRVSRDPGGNPLVFRGGTLAVVFDTGLDDYVVKQWMSNGRQCEHWIDSSYGDATPGGTAWAPSGLWTTGGTLTWTMGYPPSQPDFGILTAKIPQGCATPGPIGKLAFTPETTTIRALAIDGRRVFYAGGQTLRSHALPAPSYDPPPNDDFEHAQPLPTQAPFNTTANVAYATVQPGEPLADTKHTSWYAYRPATSGTVYVTVDARPIWDFNEQHYVGTVRYGVYTGTSRDNLTEIPHSGSTTRVDAVAGETYWIAVGSPVPEPNYQPIPLYVNVTAPSG
jgi:hypothetical protein